MGIAKVDVVLDLRGNVSRFLALLMVYNCFCKVNNDIPTSIPDFSNLSLTIFFLGQSAQRFNFVNVFKE